MALDLASTMTRARFFAKMAENTGVDPGGQESFRRSVAHSAYYACYHFALDWATLRGYKRPNNWSSHEGLWSCWFAQEPETEDIRLAGEALHAKRVRADYKVKESFNDDPSDLLDEADDLINLIQADIARVQAMPLDKRKVAWKKTGHSRPGVKRK